MITILFFTLQLFKFACRLHINQRYQVGNYNNKLFALNYFTFLLFFFFLAQTKHNLQVQNIYPQHSNQGVKPTVFINDKLTIWLLNNNPSSNLITFVNLVLHQKVVQTNFQFWTKNKEIVPDDSESQFKSRFNIFEGNFLKSKNHLCSIIAQAVDKNSFMVNQMLSTYPAQYCQYVSKVFVDVTVQNAMLITNSADCEVLFLNIIKYFSS